MILSTEVPDGRVREALPLSTSCIVPEATGASVAYLPNLTERERIELSEPYGSPE